MPLQNRLTALAQAIGADVKALLIAGAGYANLAGRAGGQSLRGGTANGETLTLSSTAGATKGKLLFGTSAYDEASNRLGIGTTAPSAILDVPIAANLTDLVKFGSVSIGKYSPAYSGIWFGGVTPAVSNYGFISNGASTFLNATGTVFVNINDGAVVAVTSTGMSIGTGAGPSQRLELPGNSNDKVGQRRNTVANTAGGNLGISQAGATVGATDKNGGTLTLGGDATATGTGTSAVKIQTARSGASGTADRAPTDALQFVGDKILFGPGTPTVSIPFSLTGSRSSGAALTNLIAMLVAIGVITDNTTA